MIHNFLHFQPQQRVAGSASIYIYINATLFPLLPIHTQKEGNSFCAFIDCMGWFSFFFFFIIKNPLKVLLKYLATLLLLSLKYKMNEIIQYYFYCCPQKLTSLPVPMYSKGNSTMLSLFIQKVTVLKSLKSRSIFIEMQKQNIYFFSS